MPWSNDLDAVFFVDIFSFSLLNFRAFLRAKRKNVRKQRRMNERDRLLTCEDKAGTDFSSLLCICQNASGGRVAIGNVEVSFSLPALWLWARGVKHICMSVIAPASLSANTDVVQTRKVHYHSPLCDCLSLSLCHPVTYRSSPASKRACARTQFHFVCHPCFQCTASLECVHVCFSVQLSGRLPSITIG